MVLLGACVRILAGAPPAHVLPLIAVSMMLNAVEEHHIVYLVTVLPNKELLEKVAAQTAIVKAVNATPLNLYVNNYEKSYPSLILIPCPLFRRRMLCRE